MASERYEVSNDGVGTLEVVAGVGSGVGFWLGARRARGSHGDTCMFGQWKWVDAYGRTHGIISGFTAFIPGKPDKSVNVGRSLSTAPGLFCLN